MVFCFLEKKIRNIIFLFLDISILCTFHQFPCLTRSRGFCTCVRLCECVYFIYLSYICAFWNSNQKTNHRLCNWAAFFPSLSPSFEWLDLSYACRLNGCIQSMQWNTCHAMHQYGRLFFACNCCLRCSNPTSFGSQLQRYNNSLIGRHRAKTEQADGQASRQRQAFDSHDKSIGMCEMRIV